MDDFLADDFFSKIQETFKNESSNLSGKNFNSSVEEKKWISLNSSLPDLIKQIVDEFQKDYWVENMRQLTGIESLIPTPNGNTKLANYHIMEPGGILGAHVDHSTEPNMGLPHILNVIIYLSENWGQNDGGATLLFDKTGDKVVERVPYKGNRVVIFLHTPYSFHGVERLANETATKRRTIYVDYYSKVYQPFKKMNLGFDTTWFVHGTTFKLGNVRDYIKPKNLKYTKTLLNYHLSRLKAKF